MDLYTDPTATTARDATPGGGSAGFFTDGIVGVKPRTVLRGWFMQLLVDEIRNVLIGAGITPNINLNNQLYLAIQALIGSATSGALLRSNNLSDVTSIPAMLANIGLFSGTMGIPGYAVIPLSQGGGASAKNFIIQWGLTAAHSQDDGPFTVTFPISFPLSGSCFAIFLGDYNSGASTGADSFMQVVSLSNYSADLMVQAPSSTPTSITAQGFWLAIGSN